MGWRSDRERRLELRGLLLVAQGGICPYCGRWLRPNEFGEDGNEIPNHGMGRNLDHVWPKSRGGPDRLGNLLCGHAKCNQKKADRLPYPCEVIWLLAVNCRLGVEPQVLA